MDSITPDLSVQNAVITNLQQQQSHVRQEVDNLTYWKQQLRDSPLALDLPTDYPRSPNQTYARATHSFTLSASLSATLKMLSRREGVSLFAILFTAFQTLLYRYTGQEDLLVGTTWFRIHPDRRYIFEELLCQPPGVAHLSGWQFPYSRGTRARSKGLAGGACTPGYTLRSDGRGFAARTRSQS
jgi:hypothetical protein